MIDDKQIQEAIAYYGGKTDPKRDDAIALAACYILQDHHFADPGKMAYSYAPPPETTPEERAETVGEYGDSDFLREIAGKPPAACWRLMNELMEDIRVIYPRAYDCVLRRLRAM